MTVRWPLSRKILLLALLNFEVWCRVFLDRRSPSDVALELKDAAG